MNAWAKAVTHPLGLAGFAIACVFGVVAKLTPGRSPVWLTLTAVAMAAIALIGGLVLAKSRISLQNASKSVIQKEAPATSAVVQQTEGAGSPAFANIQGPVSITYGAAGEKKR